MTNVIPITTARRAQAPANRCEDTCGQVAHACDLAADAVALAINAIRDHDLDPRHVQLHDMDLDLVRIATNLDAIATQLVDHGRLYPAAMAATDPKPTA